MLSARSATPPPIPPTVRAVLAARIDRLTHADKHLLQAHAVIGETATVDLLDRVGDLPAGELQQSLRRLERAGLLVERAAGKRLAYEFKHSLTQAVTYDSLLHQRRRDLHRAVMQALAGSGDFDVLARHAVQGEAWAQALIDATHEQEHFGQVGLPAVRARSHLAWTLAETGDFQGACANAEEGLRIANATDHAYTLSHACLGLADEPAAAAQLATDALGRAAEQQERGNQVYARHLLAHCHAGLWRLYARAGESAKSAPHLAAATTMYREMAMRYWLAELEREQEGRSQP